jgi:dienelactone hydrolase
LKRPRSTHSNPYWSVSSLAAATTVIVMSAINVALMDTGLGNALELLMGLALGIAVVAIATLVIYLVFAGIRGMPLAAVSVIGGALLTIWVLKKNGPANIARTLLDQQPWSMALDLEALSALSLMAMVLAVTAIAGLTALLLRGKFGALKAPRKAIILIATVALVTIGLNSLGGLVGAGTDPYPDDGAYPQAFEAPPALGNPAAPGTYTVSTLTYGAGNNVRRPEFGTNRDIESRVVDARKLLPEWKDFKKSMRERYWGFGLAEAPLNGHVWMPSGEGPYPLVLIVHGNHGMEDYSDDGYAYLGELLASRGFIAVSVDQNYINGSWSGDFQGKEMAARAWLLLEHIAQWRDWNQTPGHRFESKVDLDNIGLIGHSRGGEAVSIAHSFNRLSHFPDDATLGFNYDFNIRALVAIAQVDQRYHRRVQLTDVDFFSIHGSYDSDEPAFHGLRQMNRIRYSGQEYSFKAGVYLHGANHGQFNTGWGRHDYSPPGAWELNTAPIIPGAEQREAAKVYISAFLESSLHHDDRFLPFLKDPRSLASWLPQRTYVHQFMDSSFEAFADFEEDINASTASQQDASVDAQNLSVWREEALKHRDKRLQGSNAVVLGWQQPAAAYTIGLSDTQSVSQDRALVFSVSGSTEKPGPATEDAPATIPTIADFSVSLVTHDAQEATVQVSRYAQLIPPVRVQYMKNEERNKKDYNSDWEPILQYVEIPFSAFVNANPQLSLSNISNIRFEFDQSDNGVLILDNIGSAQITRAQQPSEEVTYSP